MTLIIRIVLGHRAQKAVIVRAPFQIALRRSDVSDTHVPVPDRAVMALANLEVHGVGVQRVRQYEILHDL